VSKSQKTQNATVGLQNDPLSFGREDILKTMRRRILSFGTMAPFVALTLGVSLSSAQAEDGMDIDFDFSAEVGLESRIFPEEAQHAGQDDDHLTGSVFLEPEFVLEFGGGDHRFTVIPFARFDSHDSNRTHFDLREANFRVLQPEWDVLLGLGKVYWGKTESRHLVDIINQTDLVESPDGEDKLGQPMLNFNYYTDYGDFAAFVLPGFREQTFPGEKGRLRAGYEVNVDHPVYESNQENLHVDFAGRYAVTLGDWDLGLSHFWGTGREARLVREQQSNGTIVLTPHYDLIHQTAFDGQLTTGPWLLKAEAMTRSGQGRRFFAGVAGFEYTFFDMDGADLGLLAEYLYDGRDSHAPQTAFEDDFFVGSRLALNDEASTEGLIGAIIDRTTGATAMSVEAERRIGESYKAEIEGQVYLHAPDEDAFSAFRQDHHITLRLTRYF